MPSDTTKTQIGIRLPTELVRHIDSRRRNKTRAEYCRELIETGMAATDHQMGGTVDSLSQSLQSLQDQLSEIRQSSLLAEREGGKTHDEIRNLRFDLATAMVGILTKIGQVVREEDQRQFARDKAESFAKRVLLMPGGNREEP